MAYVSTNKNLDVDFDAIRIAGSLANGDAITALTNSAGANGTQSTSGNRATIATNEAAGKAAGNFGASNVTKFYEFGNLWNGATEGTIYLLMKHSADVPADYLQTGLMDASGTTGANNENFPYTDGNVYTSFGTDTRKTVSRNTDFPAGSFATAYRLVTITSKASEWKFYFDGVLIYSTSSNTVHFNSNFIFGRSIVTDYFFKGKVLRILGYTAAHTGTEVTQNKTQFASDYQLTNLGYSGGSTDTPMTAAYGSFALTGQAATLTKTTNNALTASYGSFTFTGKAATLSKSGGEIPPAESLVDFDEVELDRELIENLGVSGGAEYVTEILGNTPGAGQRRIRRLVMRHAFKFGYIKTVEDFKELRNFFNLRFGRGYGFRFFPPDDNSWDNEQIGTTSTSEDEYPLIRTYEDSARTVTRRILKPVPDITVTINGSPASNYSAYTVDYATGIITFTTPASLPNGGILRVTGEYCIPVFFDGDKFDAEWHTHYSQVNLGVIEITPAMFGIE